MTTKQYSLALRCLIGKPTARDIIMFKQALTDPKVAYEVVKMRYAFNRLWLKHKRKSGSDA